MPARAVCMASWDDSLDAASMHPVWSGVTFKKPDACSCSLSWHHGTPAWMLPACTLRDLV